MNRNHQRRGAPSPPRQVSSVSAVGGVFVNIGGMNINAAAIIGIDEREYNDPTEEKEPFEPEPMQKDFNRRISIHMLSGVVFEFDDEEADAAKLWWDQSTGRSRIQSI